MRGVELSGLLVAFEGLDACGKSSLIEAVSQELQKRGREILKLAEFSDSEVGVALQTLLEQDSFLVPKEKGPLSMYGFSLVFSDLVYFNEKFIIPALSSNKIILKDRHVASVFSCEIPKILSDYESKSISELIDWMGELLKPLKKPDLTIMLKLPAEVPEARLCERGETVTDDMRSIYKQRDLIYERVSDHNVVEVDNSGDFEETVKNICKIIESNVV